MTQSSFEFKGYNLHVNPQSQHSDSFVRLESGILFLCLCVHVSSNRESLKEEAFKADLLTEREIWALAFCYTLSG